MLGVTVREQEVLGLVAAHLTNAEIAERLVLSVRTVESHVSSLIRKLDAADRRSLARRAGQLGLLGRQHAAAWPVPASAFVGRADESEELTALLSGHRMVTVTGPGGIGKTRMALHVAMLLARHRADGGWFVPLSQVSQPDDVARAVAAAIGVHEHPGISTQDAIGTALRDSDGILVLDNGEHLLAHVEQCVDRIVTDCRSVTVVVTSRARLGAAYEWVYEVPPLASSDAHELFRARAGAAGGVVPQDSRVGALCARLDGMALAIELAASRYPLLGLDGLEAALADPLKLLGSDHRSRQRSVRATIGWSVALVDDGARVVLAACSVFSAGFSVRAAHTVVADAGSEADVARALATLADHHLVRPDVGTPTTYRFQEVVRQYAAELLGARAPEIELRHAQWARDELSALTTQRHDDGWRQAFDRLAIEIRVALARVRDQHALGLRFAEELVQRGGLEEAQRVLEVLAESSTEDRVRLLRLAAGAAAARLVGDETMRLLDEVAHAAGNSGDEGAAAEALAWSVLYATLYPGIIADRPSGELTAMRLDEARRRATAGSAAEATVAAAAATLMADDHPDAEAAGQAAATVAEAVGLPVVASAALDRVCACRLLAWDYAGGLTAVRQRGRLMDPLPLDATTAFAFNDYLLMGCEASLAAGDLAGASRYAGRLLALPCYRDYVHPALGRQLQVDVLTGDLLSAVEHGERFRRSWELAGRHRASTLAVGPYALALAHGLLGHDDEREEWQDVARDLDAGRLDSPGGIDTGWAPTLDAWFHLHRGDPETALTLLSLDPDHAMWRGWATALWRPWYAAAWAEASVLADVENVEGRLRTALAATSGNPVATALVQRAEALRRHDRAGLSVLAGTFDRLGAAYQRDRTVAVLSV